ncbi:site-specific DNA-methyltransferase [Stigmatella erecta]|uniref:site-specific DNA-methyltransferase (adenine-specific) n=1 Tax=Stigmatella erecta TaxID=83460 RepID=A0A1I0LFD6_9BACT|nr:site-specific DNA-methyltransferase [Stigmatella erecta]SEU38819.1 adenine-specific DNA-methyltransferase [Stigmatella erecta]
MATGIPSKNGKARLTYRLEYEGKAPVEEVLSGERARLERVLTVAGKPTNRLYYGENLRVLRALAADPEVAGQVRLVYIDPPYATGASFESRGQAHAYADHRVGAEFLEFLRQRLILMQRLLAEDGSIYVHLDENAAHPVKVLMDEIFGPENFRAWITRKKCNPKNYTKKTYGNVADYLLFYSKSASYVWEQQFDARNQEADEQEYRHIEEGTGRRYMKVPIHAPGVRNGETGQEWKGMRPPPGKHWQYKPSKLEEMDRRGEIVWSGSGNPRRKVYLDQRPGIPVQDIWLEFRDAHNQMIKITGYPTEKNPDMLRRIICASSRPGDLVLDAFAGSGTTAHLAEELGRRWIMVDNSPLALATMARRLAHGSEPMGDFVKQRGKKKAAVQQSLLDRVLKSGLDLYVERDKAVEPIPPAQLDDWAKMLHGRVVSSPTTEKSGARRAS